MTCNESISKLAIFISRGITPKYTENTECSIVVLNQKCIRDFNISFEPARRSNLTLHKVPDDKLIKKYDVLINSTGVGTLGRIAQYMGDLEQATVDSHVTIVRPDCEFIDPVYFGYLVKAKQTTIENLAEGSTGQTELSRNAIKELKIDFVEDRKKQKEIGSILLSLDKKIQVNYQINQTLEAMAQAIFKSWFVDFEPVKAKIAAIEAGENAEGATRAAMSAISGKTDEELDQLQAEQPDNYTQLKTTAELFPAAMHDSELGEIPEGWESKAFSTVIDVNPVRRLPKGKLATKVSMADLNTWQSWIDSWQKEEYKSGPKFKNGDNLFARITPSLENGKTAFVNFLSAGETAFGSTEFIVFGPKIIASGSYIFCLSRSEHIRETTINAMTGTSGRQRVPNDCFDHLLICVPSDKIVGKFNEITVSLFKMIEHNSKESIHLKKARDSLLPKLLAGELSVEAAEFVGGN